MQEAAYGVESFCLPISVSLFDDTIPFVRPDLDSIVERLGITVAPMDVRLQPRSSDLYRWNILPAKAYLFRKNLSKLSTGVYNQIIEGVGTYIEAVEPSEPQPAASEEMIDRNDV